MFWKIGKITFSASLRRALREAQLDTGMYFASAIPLWYNQYIFRKWTKDERLEMNGDNIEMTWERHTQQSGRRSGAWSWYQLHSFLQTSSSGSPSGLCQMPPDLWNLRAYPGKPDDHENAMYHIGSHPWCLVDPQPGQILGCFHALLNHVFVSAHEVDG